MAIMIAAFAGKNAKFKEYLREQQTSNLASALGRVQESIQELKEVLPLLGLQQSNFDGNRLLIHVKDLAAMEMIPGIPVVTDADPKSRYRYQVSKWFRGSGFYCWATAADIKKLARATSHERGQAQ